MYAINKKIAILTSIIVLILAPLSFVFAQPPISHKNHHGRPHRMDSEKMKEMFKMRINEELNIIAEQKEKFWAKYDERVKKMKALNHKIKENYHRLKENLKTIKDEEVIEIIDLELNLKQDMIAFERTSNKELLQIISPKQLIKLKAVEHQLRRMMRGRKRMGKHHKPRFEKHHEQ